MPGAIVQPGPSHNNRYPNFTRCDLSRVTTCSSTNLSFCLSIFLCANSLSFMTPTTSSHSSSSPYFPIFIPLVVACAGQIEQNEEDDVDDLLAFTDNLNYDKYIEELDVTEALASVHARIKQLEADQAKAAAAAALAATTTAVPVVAADGLTLTTAGLATDAHSGSGFGSASGSGSDASQLVKLRAEAAKLTAQAARQARQREQRALQAARDAEHLGEDNTGHGESARELLQQSKDLRAVHSTASMTAVLDKLYTTSQQPGGSTHSRRRATEAIGPLTGSDYPIQIGSQCTTRVVTTLPVGPDPILVDRHVGIKLEQPDIVSLGDSGSTAKYDHVKGPPNPSHLPYLYRNPAV
jgi:hypothetical protein